MKLQTTNKLFAYIAIIMLVSIMVFNSSCRKEISIDAGFDAMKTNIPPASQIIYTDVIPDSIVHSNNEYSLDLNNDGIKDFGLSIGWNAGARCGAECLPGSLFLTVNTLNNNFVLDNNLEYVNNVVTPLNLNDLIEARSKVWYTGTAYILNHAGSTCCGSGSSWIHFGSIEKYVGLKFIKDLNTYYGWAHLFVTVGLHAGSFTIKDYAYNSIPNQPILGGQTK